MLQDQSWDVTSVSPLSALHMFIGAVQALADATGEVPPTPPISRPPTPKAASLGDAHSHLSPPERSPSPSPMSPISPLNTTTTQTLPPINLPSPEAHRNEPIPAVEVGADAEAVSIQRAAISRRFFVKTAPPFSLSDYLLRLHQYCPHSSGVYLAAAGYVHRLCVAEVLVPATAKTIHRLSLASIRVASKALEDNKWKQDRVSKVGGVSRRELLSMEVNLCYLLDFELFVTAEELATRMFLLQQAATQSQRVRKRLSDGFQMRLPTRVKAAVAV